MTGRGVILGGERPGAGFGPERFDGRCEAEDCDRTFSGRGTIEARKAAARAQKHADRTGHRIAAEWANRR